MSREIFDCRPAATCSLLTASPDDRVGQRAQVFCLFEGRGESRRRRCGNVEIAEWHRAVVFGRLTAFASSLKKGDHVQIQGQLRTREYVKDEARKTVTEIRVTSILKLDRSHKQPAAAQGEMQEVA